MSMVDESATTDSFKRAGFVDIHSRQFKLPATPWAKDQKMQQLGAFSRLAMEQDLDGTNTRYSLKRLHFARYFQPSCEPPL